MVTLRDIAQRAGVSPATASRALTDSAPVSPEAKAKVLAAAEELGYRVNAVARSLRVQRTDTIGLLLPDIRNPFFTELAYHVEQAASRAGLTVMLGSADEQAERQDRYLEALARHQVDGIIAVPQGEPTNLLRSTAATVPTVFLDRDPGIDGVSVVTSDNTHGMLELVDHLVALGHRKIAVVAGPQSTSTGRARLMALRTQLAGHGIELGDSDVVEGNFQLESGVRATEQLLDHAQRDALIAADNLMGLGALQVLRRRSLIVGSDIALACVDDHEWFPLMDPPITVLAQNTADLGQAALDQLLSSMQGNSPRTVEVPMTLVPRGSCGEPRPDQKQRR